MTSKRTVLGWLAALALVAAACGGGGDAGPAALAAGDVPIVPEVAGDAPPPGEGEIVEEVEEDAPADGEPGAEGEPATDPATDPEAPPAEAEPAADEPHTYADDLERAATMMVAPADVSDVVPDLRVNAAYSGPLDSFTIYRRDATAAAIEIDPARRALAGYEAVLVGPGSDEARERLGSAHPEVSMLAFTVELYTDDAAAAARLAELRAGHADDAAVADQPGLPGNGFVAHSPAGDPSRVTVGFAGHGAVGLVVAYGTSAPEPAVTAARALAVRVWKAQEGMLAPRDPLAGATGYQVPSAALESFEAAADVVVSAGDVVLERERWTGKYQGPDRFSCQQTHYLGGTEELVAEVVAAGSEASVFDLATLSSGKHDRFSPEVAAAVAGCPVFPEAWREHFLADPALLHAAPASTIVGPGTTLRTRDEWRLAQAVGTQPDAGSRLEDFSIFVTEDGWATAIHYEVAYPPEAALEAFGVAERVTVRNSVRVTAVDGAEVPEPLYFGGDEDSFAIGVGEEVVPPADEPAPAGGSGGGDDAGSSGDEGGAGDTAGGDVQAAGMDDGLFGSGTFVTGGGSDDGHFAGTTPVGGAEDAATQDAISNTMLGLVAYYVDNGDYRATPDDVAFYVGVVTTTDPSSGGTSSTVYVPGDQETVVWAAGGSGYFCMAAQANDVIVFGSGEAAADVDTFAECVSGGSTAGW